MTKKELESAMVEITKLILPQLIERSNPSDDIHLAGKVSALAADIAYRTVCQLQSQSTYLKESTLPNPFK